MWTCDVFSHSASQMVFRVNDCCASLIQSGAIISYWIVSRHCVTVQIHKDPAADRHVLSLQWFPPHRQWHCCWAWTRTKSQNLDLDPAVCFLSCLWMKLVHLQLQWCRKCSDVLITERIHEGSEHHKNYRLKTGPGSVLVGIVLKWDFVVSGRSAVFSFYLLSGLNSSCFGSGVSLCPSCSDAD